MNFLIPFLLVAADTGRVPLAPPLPPPAITILIVEDDRWLGEDKFKHFAMSYMITAGSFSVARTVTDRDASLAAAVALGAAAGILKELYDRRDERLISVRDLIWDAAGIAAGVLIAKQTR